MYTSIVVRSCTKEDLHTLCSINMACFSEEEAFTLEEFQYIFEQQMSKRKALSNGPMIRVAEISIDGEAPVIAGYIYFNKTTIAEGTIRHLDMEICSIAVEPIYRRYGVGRRLIETVFAIGDFFESSTNRYSVFADIPEHLLPAQLFFKQMGFLCTSIEYPSEQAKERDTPTLYVFELESKLQPISSGGKPNARKDR